MKSSHPLEDTYQITQSLGVFPVFSGQAQIFHLAFKSYLNQMDLLKVFHAL